MKYIDSSVIIGAYFQSDPYHLKCKEFMAKLSHGEFDGVISIFGLVEIGGFISRNSNPEMAQQFIIKFFQFPNLYVSYSDDFELFMNSTLAISIAKGLSGSDAIHFISAMSLAEVDEIVTLDHDFNRTADKIRICLLR